MQSLIDLSAAATFFFISELPGFGKPFGAPGICPTAERLSEERGPAASQAFPIRPLHPAPSADTSVPSLPAERDKHLSRGGNKGQKVFWPQLNCAGAPGKVAGVL